MIRLSVALGIVGLLALLGQTPRAAGSSPVTITVDADPNVTGVQPARVVAEGATFSVSVRIGSVSDLQAFNFELEYDQTLLSAPTVVAGPDTDRNPDADEVFLTSTSRVWSCSPPDPSGDVDPSGSVGAALLSCFSTGATAGPNVGPTETLLATIEFNALAVGTSQLTLRNANTFQTLGIETGSCNPVVILAATCTGASITVDTDADTDLVPDSLDNCPATSNLLQENADGDPFGDVCDNCPATSNPLQENADGDPFGDVCDNCPNWPNPGQGLPPWPVGATDPDCDGFDTPVENFVGTLPLVQCAADTTTNNEAPDPAPTDFDDDKDTDIFDVLSIKPFFGSPGSNPYSVRHDLQGQDGDNDIFDVLAMKPFFSLSCT